MTGLETVDVLREYRFRCNTSHLQQFFIVDDSIINKLVESAEIDAKETVLEIGTGIGNLTCELAKKARKVIGVEIDKRFMPILAETLQGYSNIEVIYKDALRIRWPKFNCLVASVPFTIVEPIIYRLTKLRFRSALLVLGDRFKQTTIEFGLNPNSSPVSKLSALTHVYFNVEQIGTIEKDQFYPTPRTDAVIVKLTYKKRKEKLSPFLRKCRLIFSRPNSLVRHIIFGDEENTRGGWRYDISAPEDLDRDLDTLSEKILNKRADALSNSDFAELFKFYERKRA